MTGPQGCGCADGGAAGGAGSGAGGGAGGVDVPVRSRGVIGLFEENCTVCMLCARECPDWCIVIEAHKEDVPPLGPHGRPRSRNVLDRFAIDFSLCMYCGICIEVCPFDALFWSPEHEYAGEGPAPLVHERDQLREWMWTVPPPPPDDPRGAPAAEVVAARAAAARSAARAASGTASGTASGGRPSGRPSGP